MGLTHLTRVFTTDVGDTCVHVFVGSRLISSLDPPQIVSNITLAHSHFQFPTGYEPLLEIDKCDQFLNRRKTKGVDRQDD